VNGSADGNDHTLVSGVAEITSGTSTRLKFKVLEDALSESPEDLMVQLDANLNLGSQRSSKVVITESNIAPVVELNAEQQGETRLTVAANDGVVQIHATLSDANPQDQLSGQWDFGKLTNVILDDNQLSFDPAEQVPGLYEIGYEVTDNGTPTLTASNRVFIVIRSNLPVLSSIDSDGDLIPDSEEGFADSDGDGIADYLDANAECNVMPTELLGQNEFVAEGDPGVCLRLGSVAVQTNAGGLQIANESVAKDDIALNVGGIFDFIAYGLPEQGQSYSLVLPQRLPIPANAVYRKFSDMNGWVNFVSDERNRISSAMGERGFCPPPGDTAWTPGLTEGSWCVQLTIQDGGPNDADGFANQAIVDPGGVSVALNGNRLPVAAVDRTSVPADGNVVVNVLANDTDADGDNLTISQAVSNFGIVTILSDQQLSYTPNQNYIGTDVIVYSVTDGNGGTASSEVVISVLGNRAPIVINEEASTDDRTILMLAVLANDFDPDNHALRISAVAAEQGIVSIEADQRLRYTPKKGFAGVDLVTYTVVDGKGGSTLGQVKLTIQAYQEVVINNRASGGSMSLWMLFSITTLALLRRRSQAALLTIVLCSFSAVTKADTWYLQAGAGQSHADRSQQQLRDSVGQGAIIAIDNSDSSVQLAIGYQLYPSVALELSYLELGEATATILADSLTPAQYHELVKKVTPMLANGYTAAARFSLWRHGQWSLEAPIGFMRWDYEIDSQLRSNVLSSKDSGTDLFYGLQINYLVSENWQVGFSVQKLQLEPNNVSNWLLHLRYHF
jgi:hypothetical protein